MTHFVKLCPSSVDSVFRSCLIHAVVCPGLCMPLIFGLPFLEVNEIVCDHKRHLCIIQYKKLNYNLLNPPKVVPPPPPKLKLCDQLLKFKAIKKDVLRELLTIYPKIWQPLLLPDAPLTPIDFISAILAQITLLEIKTRMSNEEKNSCELFFFCFSTYSTCG